MKKNVYKIIFLITVLMSIGCSQRLADLTVVSPNNVSLSELDLDKHISKKNVIGRAVKPSILLVPLGTPTLEEAVEDALRKGDGDLMTDVSIYDKSWSAIIFGQYILEVQGNVIKTRNN
jgi:hypothetical protein